MPPTPDALPSAAAQRDAAGRTGLSRLPAPYGYPDLDDALARDVAGQGSGAASEQVAGYLRLRTGFFDRVTVGALDRGAAQIVIVGAGYDGRALRYAKPGVRWWEVDDPATQADKRDRLARLGIETPQITFVSRDPGGNGLAGALVASGFEPDAPALLCCPGSALRLGEAAIAALLADLRSLATPGTRLAIGLPPDMAAADGPGLAGLLRRSRWRAAEISERVQRAGLRVLVPEWAPAPAGTPPSLGRIAAFTERTLHRSGGATLAGHLESEYGVTVSRTRELDLGVHRVDLDGGRSWVARIFPASRDVTAVAQDARLLTWLAEQHFPAERCAAAQPVSVHDGQGVLVTEFAGGRALPARPESFELLGRLLGRLHCLPAGGPASERPGGAWHHLLPEGSPEQELPALMALLHDARHRAGADDAERYDTLLAAVQDADSCADLPHALVHPDPVPANAIRQDTGDPVVIDWSGAGWGPRVVSLGCLLWAAPDKRSVSAAVSGYLESVAIEPAEVDRLAAAMRLRPLVLACWAFATGRGTLQSKVEWWEQQRRRIEAAASHARSVAEHGNSVARG